MRYFFIIAGVLFLAVAVFAYQLGLDNNREWGGGRTILMKVGLASMLAGIAIHFWGDKVKTIIKIGADAINNAISRPNRVTTALILAVVFTIVVYSWVFQMDQKISRRSEFQEYDYYSELARSFKDGRLFLSDTPPLELLALDNPYDYFLRKELGIENFPWDVSLYKEKFYLYWGPAPSVIIMIFSKEQLSNIADFHLTLVFACGAFLYMALLIWAFWKKSLHYAPAWLLGFLLIVIGLSTPVTIMLKSAKVYEAAIFGCQFFFIGGCYWVYSSMGGSRPETWKLVIASLHWSLAVGTRVIMLPAVVFCVIFTLIYLYVVFNKSQRNLAIPISLVFPLVLTGCGLAWYNWARFDSIFEFGQVYQLAQIDYTTYHEVFTTSRIPQNIKLYLTHPLKLIPKFPYINRIEYLHSSERMGGLAYLTPFVALLILPVYYLFNNLLLTKKIFRPDVKDKPADNWLLVTLTGSGLISFAILMSFYFVTMRYMEDFMPALLVLITVQLGRYYDMWQRNIILRRILVFTAIVLGLITITVNIILTIPNSGTVFMLNFIKTASKIIGLK